MVPKKSEQNAKSSKSANSGQSGPSRSRWSPLFLLALCLGSALFVFLLTGHSGTFRPHRHHHRVSPTKDRAEDIRSAVFSAIDPQRIAENLRAFTQEPHVAGTKANGRVAERLAAIWKRNGLEDVHTIPYDVLLSYPDFGQPNHVSVLDPEGHALFRTSGLSPQLLPLADPTDFRASIQWLAYSAEGTVEGEPVYCHYGRPEDFERLEREFGIASLKGKIAILRYNVEFRGDKVRHAQDRGAMGAILYSDPAEVARDGIDPAHTFPHTDWMPSGGVQRGSVMEVNGDPLTPLLPARHDFARQKSVEQGYAMINLGTYTFLPFPAVHAFPSTVWMPSGGVQRGTLKELNGDPLTPLLPSRADFFRGRTLEEARAEKAIPSIPVVPLGYGDAAQILSRMDGPEVPREWQGQCGNFTYRLGPRMREGQGQQLKLEVRSKMEIKTIQNVIGYIHGSEHADEWVMLGNHFDAWVFGSIDPNSGSAILAEVGRAFAETVKTKGWRPKRTLVFCAWDAEEHGLIGSTEFVQEFAEVLAERSVVYLNVDLISSNQTLDVRTVPSLYSAVTEAAKQVSNPVETETAQGRHSVFDSWLHYFPAPTSWLPDTPEMAIPGGGSDHATFLNFLGIPVVDFTYRNASWLTYPLYHSRYELPFVNEHLFDSHNLAVHKAVGQYWAELARSFADAEVLPINATVFAHKLLADYVGGVKESIMALHSRFPEATEPAVRQLSALLQNVRLFMAQAEKFERELAEAEEDPARAQWANRRLRKLDQCFVNPALGLAREEPEKRHVLFSLASDDSYQATVMAAVQQKIAQLEKAPEAQRTQLGRELALELTVIQQSTLCAVNTLREFV